MVNFNPLAFITKPFTNLRDRFVSDAIRGGMSRAAKDVGGNFLDSMTKGLDNIGKFAGNHKKELALGAGAMLALGLGKQLFWPKNTPVPPPPPTMTENITKFLQDNWKVAAPVAGLIGVAAPLLMHHLSSQNKNNGANNMLQNPQAFMQSMMQGISNIQSGKQEEPKNPFMDFDPAVDLSDVSHNGHNLTSPVTVSDREKAINYMNNRLNRIRNK